MGWVVGLRLVWVGDRTVGGVAVLGILGWFGWYDGRWAVSVEGDHVRWRCWAWRKGVWSERTRIVYCVRERVDELSFVQKDEDGGDEHFTILMLYTDAAGVDIVDRHCRMNTSIYISDSVSSS
jgi:xanthine/CO dehydrogenase XdhC/CoxF family maturation factor